MQNHLFDVLILNGSGRRQRIKMFVISAAVYVEYTAEGFDIVLESKWTIVNKVDTKKRIKKKKLNFK